MSKAGVETNGGEKVIVLSGSPLITLHQDTPCTTLVVQNIQPVHLRLNRTIRSVSKSFIAQLPHPSSLSE